MKEAVVLPWFVVPLPIHKTETVKRTFEFVCLPEFSEDRFAFFPEVPLQLRVADILYHSSMENWRVARR